MTRISDLGEAFADRGYQVRVHVQNVIQRPTHDHYPVGDGAPVLILPGVFETWQFLRPVADHLHGLGHPVHVLPELGYNRLTISDSAAVAQRYVDSHDLRGVLLIAHSKGGLIGKHMMVTDDRDGRVHRLVAVNSPFGGSSLARYAPVRSLRDFIPTDRTVVALGANLAANARITSVFSRKDPIIPGGSRLEGATNIELPMVGHFRPLSSPAFFDILSATSGREAPTR